MIYAVRSRQPDFIEIGLPTVVEIYIYQDGVGYYPTTAYTPASTNYVVYSLYNASGTVVTGLDGVTASRSTDGRMYYTVLGTATSSLTASDHYTSRWKIATAAGTWGIQFDREAIVCRRAPTCPIAPVDLERRNSALRGDWELPAGKTSFQAYIDEAWDQTVSRAIASGVGVHKIHTWYGLREYVARLTEAGIARDLMVTRSGATKWQKLYDDLMLGEDDPRSVEWAWAKSGFRVDRNQDGIPDSGAESESKPGSFQQSTDEPGWRGF